MKFDYCKVTQSMDSLDIEDIGNCSLLAFNDTGQKFILIIDTQLGTTRVFNYGPINIDLELLPRKVDCSFERLNYSESRIKIIIKNFLNNYMFKITQAQVIDKQEALNNCRSLIEYMRQDILY